MHRRVRFSCSDVTVMAGDARATSLCVASARSTHVGHVFSCTTADGNPEKKNSVQHQLDSLRFEKSPLNGSENPVKKKTSRNPVPPAKNRGQLGFQTFLSTVRFNLSVKVNFSKGLSDEIQRKQYNQVNPNESQ